VEVDVVVLVVVVVLVELDVLVVVVELEVVVDWVACIIASAIMDQEYEPLRVRPARRPL
jgi:hypothetical protein